MSVAPRRRRAPVAARKARDFLRNADPVLGRVIDAHPGFRPRAWMDELPPLDAFGTLIFQVVGQQLSVASTRAIVARIEGLFGGRMPTPTELLAGDPQLLRTAGLSARKGSTIRALAERFVDGRLSDETLSRMTDEEVEAALTEVPGIGPWSARGFLLVALDRPDVFLTGDIALRRAIQRVYRFDHVPTEAELSELSDRWRPYRSLAVSYLFASEYDG
jgi:DNA-3-methyladenine glycosylase II